MPKHQVSLPCPAAEYPCSAQPQSILTLPNRKVSLQCSTTTYPRSAQQQSIPAVTNHQLSLRCPTTKYPCSAQPQISLLGPTEKYPCSAQPQSIPGVPNSRVSLFLQHICSAARKSRGGRETLHFLCNNIFRVGMLEVNIFCVWAGCLLFFCCLRGGRVFFVLFGKGTRVHSRTGLPGSSLTGPTTKKDQTAKKKTRVPRGRQLSNNFRISSAQTAYFADLKGLSCVAPNLRLTSAWNA